MTNQQHRSLSRLVRTRLVEGTARRTRGGGGVLTTMIPR